MPFPLHKAPKGLLELFRLKTLGGSPFQFGDTVQPTVDVDDFYAADVLFSAEDVAGAATGAINTTAGLAVQGGPIIGPQRIYGIGGLIIMGAAPGTFIEWAVGFVLPSFGFPGAIVGTGRRETIIAAQVIQFGSWVPKLVLPPGAQMFVRLYGDAAGVDHELRLNSVIANLTP